MTNLIDFQMEKIKKEDRVGLMTHLIVGYPSLDKTYDLAKVMERSGADFIELQIPFSDPLADGPTIMRACEKALKGGTTVKDSFEIAKRLTSNIKIPVLFMAYFNTVFKYGVERFCKDAKKNGISGLIIPDMPIEEEGAEGFLKHCQENNLYSIRVLSPASTADRLEKNSAVAGGFVYFTARQGVTGATKGIDPQIASYLKKMRRYFKIPLAVGFGISTRERIEQIDSYCEIVVVGSAIVDIIERAKTGSIEKKVATFIKSLKG